MPYLAGVIDHSRIYRRGLSQDLKDHGIDVVVVDEAQLRMGVSIDVFVIVAGSPGGRELIREAHASHPDTPIVAIAPSSSDGARHHAALLTDGATAVLSMDAPGPAISSAVLSVLEDWGVLVLRGEDIRAFSAIFRHVLDDDPRPLEDEEVLLLQRLFQGATRQTLADEFHVALRTLDRHIQDIYRKLNASNHTDAILRALLWGYLTRSASSEVGS